MSNFLEIDSKILEKNLLLQGNAEAENLENFFRSPETFLKDSTNWKLVTPIAGGLTSLCLSLMITEWSIIGQRCYAEKGYQHKSRISMIAGLCVKDIIAPIIYGICVKTTDSKGNKVFINICKLDDIPEPKDLSEAELLQLWQSDDVSDFRIPLSIQEPHDEFDKSGNPTIAYDVAINSKFFQKIQTNMVFQSFVLQVVMEGIENKFDVELKKEGYVILQNRKSLGELKPHRIRTGKASGGKAKPLIEELSSTNGPSGSGDHKRVPEHRLYENIGRKCLVGEFHLPAVVTSRDLNLEVNEDRIVLESCRGGYSADFFIPLRISEADTTASFSLVDKMLTVTMPIVSTAT